MFTAIGPKTEILFNSLQREIIKSDGPGELQGGKGSVQPPLHDPDTAIDGFAEYLISQRFDALTAKNFDRPTESRKAKTVSGIE